MNRPLVLVNTTGSVVFDGNEGVTFVVAMESSVSASRIRIKNISPGQLYTFIFRQDGTGGHSFQWPSSVQNATVIDHRPLARSVVNLIGDTGGTLRANIPGTWNPS